MIRRSRLRIATRRGKTRHGRDEKRGSASHRNALEQLAAVNVDHRRSAIVAQIEDVSATQLVDRKRQKACIRREIESCDDLRADFFLCVSALFEQLEHTRCRRIEQMDTIENRVIDQHLLVQRVLEKT